MIRQEKEIQRQMRKEEIKISVLIPQLPVGNPKDSPENLDEQV